MQANVLAQLKDIHMPPAVSVWPLAPGWYVVFALILILLAGCFYWVYKKWQQQQRRKTILAQVDRLYFDYQQGQEQTLAQLSTLLRRVALKRYPRRDIAGLYGDAWLQFLNAHCPKKLVAEKPFTQKVGKILLSAPYKAHSIQGADETFKLVKMWIKHNV